jgi:topoisomerase IV subunit B
MPTNSKPSIYDESKIKTLSSLEHIRLRTGMYIGRIGDGSHYDDGCYILLKEVIDNAIDEFIMGHGKKIDITIKENKVSVRDYGRGIPLGKIVDCVSQINTGAKYNDDVFQFSVGLNGVGAKAVNALSKEFLVRSVRDGKYAEASFKLGKKVSHKQGKTGAEPTGTLISFIPDPKIFESNEFKPEHIEKRLKHYSYLNTGLKLNFNGVKYESKDGLLDLIREEFHEEMIYPPIHYYSQNLEMCLAHSNSRYGESLFSFVNGQFTSDGGTHLSAFREGILKAINEFAKKRFDGDDVRESIIGAIAIRLKDPVFESQTKNKLGNTEIRSQLVNKVREILIDYLHRNPTIAQKIISKIEDTQQLRKELQQIKKIARERSKAISLRIPQLKDCKVHYNKLKNKGHDSMLFITEGVSAAGSIVSCRDVNLQAIFTLKGKPLNVCELKRDAIYKNDEMYNLMRSLNIEDNVAALRYSKVILATDADVDGLHIRNLMITFFLKFFDQLVADGHLYVLETPLFRVRNKQKTIYCYSERERDKASAALKRGHEITRFKGLGEISPKEFKKFIGPEMRLSQVEYAQKHKIDDILTFYMGRNTADRKQYIIDNLIIDVEE